MRSQRLALLAGLLVASGGCSDHQPPTNSPETTNDRPVSRPHMDYRSVQVGYAGPEGEVSAPGDLGEIRLGWFGPSDPEHPTAGLMWQAAQMAIDEANDQGGCQDTPFRLVTAWSDNPWGTGVRDVVRLAYTDQVWGIVGAPDGASAHLVEQVIAKARLPFISSVATDKTANLVNVPWIFSCVPGDHLIAPAMAAVIAERARNRSFLLISGTDHDSRLTTVELLKALKRLQLHPARHMEIAPTTREWDAVLVAVRETQVPVVVVIADAAAVGHLAGAVAQANPDVLIVAGPRAGKRAFLDQRDSVPVNVCYPVIWHSEIAGSVSREFTERFIARFGREPDYTAAYTYDAVNLLIMAIREAGLNRVRIGEAIRALSPYSGVTGTIHWDPTGHNDQLVEHETLFPNACGMIRDHQGHRP